MGKRKGIVVELDVDSDTINKVSKLWECFGRVTGLKPNQIEGIVYSVTRNNKIKYLIAERRTSNKNGLSIDDVEKVIPVIASELGIDAGYCIVHIPEKGWTRSKVKAVSAEYNAELEFNKFQFRVERFNPNDNTVIIRSTSCKNN